MALLDFLDDLPREPEFPYELPEGVRLLGYCRLEAPVQISAIGQCINVDRMIKASLLDVKHQLSHPGSHGSASMAELLQRLEAVGVRLEIIIAS